MGIADKSRRERVVLTRPRFRVITRTKCEVNMTRKYRVASSAIFPKIVWKLRLVLLHRFAKKTMDKNTRKSGV